VFNADVDDHDAVVSVTQRVDSAGLIVGVDLAFDDLYQDFVYLPADRGSRVAVVDVTSGRLAFHSFLYDRVIGKASSKLGRKSFTDFESDKLLRQIAKTTSGTSTSDKSTHSWHRVQVTTS
jgi:hypothetical protein